MRVDPRVKITQEEVVDRQTVLQIEMEDEDMAPYLDRAYRKVAQRTNVPGFRKGKAPRSIIEGMYGKENLVSESISDVLPTVTHEAIAKQGLDLGGTPSVEVVGLAPVTLKATVPLTPSVDLGDYLDIRVEEEPAEVTDEAIAEELETLRRRDVAWEPVDRPVAFDDLVTMDVIGHVDDNTIIDSADVEHLVTRDSPMPFVGFSEHIAEKEVGKPFEFHLDIPGNHVDASLAGKEAHFRVTVKGVKKPRLPELDDEFAKGVDEGYDTLVELREAVRARLQDEEKQAQDMRFRESALVKLVEDAVCELPPLLIDHEVQEITHHRNQFVGRMNMTMADYYKFTGLTEEQHLGEMRESAVGRLTRSYAVSQLVKAEGITVSSEELEARLAEVAESESEDSTDYSLSEVRAAIMESLLVGKAIDRLVEIAKGQSGVRAEKGEEEADDSES